MIFIISSLSTLLSQQNCSVFFFCHDINCKIPTHHGRGGIIHLRIVHDNVNWLLGKDLYRYEGQTGEQIIFVDVAISSEILPSDYQKTVEI